MPTCNSCGTYTPKGRLCRPCDLDRRWSDEFKRALKQDDKEDNDE